MRDTIPGIEPGTPLDYAIRYARLGWHVFPVHSIIDGICSCGNKDCRNPGKHPLSELAPNGVKNATVAEHIIRDWWERKPRANIAIAAGQISGIFLVDVDINPEKGKHGGDTLYELETKYSPLPDTVQAESGGGGLHYIFRCPPGVKIPSKTNTLGQWMDTRGEGGYFIVEPGSHISGGTYIWIKNRDPLSGARVYEPPDWLIELITRPAAEQATPGSTGGRLFDAALVREIRSALMCIPVEGCDYDTWLKLGMCLHHESNGSQQAFGLWSEWCQMSEFYNPEGLIKKWRSFGGYQGDPVSLATLFKIAEGYGWINIARKDQQIDERTESLLAEANGNVSIDIIDNPLPKPPETLPIPSLNELANWIDSTTDESWSVATQQAVLSIVSAATSRLYCSESNESSHTYLAIVGQSVGQLRYASQAVYNLMAAAGLRRMTRQTRFTAPMKIYQTLNRSPATLYLSDDYGQILGLSKRQPSGAQEHTMNVLASIYNMTDLQLDSADDIGLKSDKNTQEDQPVIYRPALSMLTLLSDDQLAYVMQGKELGRGALEQLCMVFVSGDPDYRIADSKEPPKHIIEHLRTIRGVQETPLPDANLIDYRDHAATSTPVQQVAHFEVNAENDLNEIDQYLRQIARDKKLSPLASGARKTLKKICIGLAAWDDPQIPTIRRAMAEWAGRYVVSSFTHLIDRYETVKNDDGKQSVYQSVLEYIQQAGPAGISPRRLQQSCKAFRKMPSQKQRQDLLDVILDDEAVIERKTPNGQGRVFIHSSFVKKQQNAEVLTAGVDQVLTGVDRKSQQVKTN